MATKFLSPEAQFHAGVNNRDEAMSIAGRRLTATVTKAVSLETVGDGAGAAGEVDQSSFAAIQNQEDAPPCTTCGSIMMRSGACYKCSNCGTTSGCA